MVQLVSSDQMLLEGQVAKMPHPADREVCVGANAV